MNKEERDLNFGKLFAMYVQKWWVIALCGLFVACLLGAYAQTKSHQPYVEITNKIMIVNANHPDTQGIYEAESNIQKNVFMTFLETNTLLEEIQKNMQSPMELAQLKSMIKSEYDPESTAFIIKIKHVDATLAQEVSQKLIQISQQYMQKNYEVTAFNFYVLDSKEEKISPGKQTVKSAIVGAIIGVFISVVVLFIIFVCNKKIDDEEDVSYYLDLNCWGSVSAKKANGLSFITTQLILKSADIKKLAVCSFSDCDTNIVNHLAMQMSNKGKKVLYVYKDQTNGQPVQSDEHPQLWTLSYLDPAKMLEQVQSLTQDYQFILFDLTKLNQLDEKLLVASTAETCVLLITQGKENGQQVWKWKKRFEDCGISYAGAILYEK